MAWYSILPAHLSGIETWVIRICFILALINLSPWLIAFSFDIIYYIFRFVWHYVPILGGRAQGEARPRAPTVSDSKRRRTLSLTGMMSVSGQDQGYKDDSDIRSRHKKTLSDESIAEEEEGEKGSG